MGLVYHAHYIDYFEAARTEMLRSMGLAYRELEEAGVIMPVVDLSVRYRRPALYDDLLEIHVAVEDPPSTRIKILYQVRRRGESEVLATGHVTLCFVDRDRGRPIAAPEQLQTLFEHGFMPSDS